MVDGPSATEIERQYRLVKQHLDMHSMLRDGYARRELAVQIVLFACATVFCATTFVTDSLFIRMGLAPDAVRLLLGIASISAFFCSIVLLMVDWKGQSARHGDAANRWSGVLRRYREARREDGSWSEIRHQELSDAYWSAADATIQIPSHRFNGLKARHLTKVEISKIQSVHPGAPKWLLSLVIRLRGAWAALWTILKSGNSQSK